MRCAALLVAAVMVAVAFASSPSLTPLWSLKLPFGTPASGPMTCFGNNMYYVNDENGTVWAINTTSQRVQWSLRWDDLSQLLVFPDSDTLVVVVEEGTWGVSASTGALKWVNNTYQFGGMVAQSKSVLLGNNENSMTSGITTLNAYDAATGQQLWTTPGFTIPDITGEVGVMSTQDSNDNNYATAINLRTGAVIWKRLVQNYISAGNGLALVVNTSASNFENDLIFLSATTGMTVGTVKNFTAETATLKVVFTDDLAILSDSTSFISAYNCSSVSTVWTASLNIPSLVNGVNQLFISATGVVAMSNTNETSHVQLFNLTGFRLTDGRLKWTIVQPPTTSGFTLFFLGSLIYIPNLQGYGVWSESTGAMLSYTFSEQLPFGPGSQQISRGVVYTTSTAGVVMAFAEPRQ